MSYSLLAVIFLGSAMLAIAVAVRAAHFRQQPAWRYLALTMVAVALWCFSDAIFFVLAPNDEARWFWLVVGYMASIATAPLIFSVALCFAGYERLLTPFVRIVLWAPFALGMVLALTNAWHSLIWDPTLAPLDFKSGAGHGAYFFLLLPLAYGLPLIAALIFLYSCWRLRHIYRRQALVLSVAVFLPLAASMLYFTELNPFPGVDLAPAAFAATGVLGLYSMAQLRFMELRPIYRDALFEQMRDGAIVLDSAGCLLDFNPAAQQLLAIDERCVGTDIRPRLAAQFVLDDVDLTAEGSYTMLATRAAPPHYFDVRVSASGAEGARLVVWRDTTRLQAAIVAAYEQEILLAERQRAEAAFAADIHRAVAQLKAQIRLAIEQIDRGHIGLATATLAEAHSVTAGALLAGAGALQESVDHPEDFVGAVNRYVLNFARAAGLAATFAADESLRTDGLASGTRLQLVRILQEALENVGRHAAARHIEVSLARTKRGLALAVCDDGCGFDPTDGETRAAGSGLESMQRRALAVRGELTIDSAPGQGTCVRLDLPVAPHAAALRGLRAVLAHGHPIVLDGLRALLGEQGAAPVAIGRDLVELTQALDVTQPELILLDIDLPGGAPDMTEQIKRLRPEARLVLLLESASDPRVPAMLHRGADGYLISTLATTAFLDALTQLVEGSVPLQAGMAAQVLLEFQRQDNAESSTALTARQREILRLIGEGFTYDEIGARLYLSERTVRYHTEQIRKRLGLAGRSELVKYARRHYPARRD